MFNELCIRHDNTRLSKPLDSAVKWLQQFSELLAALSKYRSTRELRVPIEFKKAELVTGYVLGRLLAEEENLVPKDHRDNIKNFTDKGRYLEEIEEIVDDEGIFEYRTDVYIFQYKGEIARGFGAAHLIDGLAISIDTEEIDWDCVSVDVEKHEHSGMITVSVEHACKYDHLGIPQRVFERNPKHDLVVERDKIAKLDLDDGEAQAVLDKAAQPDKETRFFGFSQRTGRFYVFPSHLEGYYHAYPVEITEITQRKQVLRELLDLEVIDEQIYRRYKKGR
jgi:hypothetical protein